MDLQLTPAADGDRPRLEALLELYAYDLSDALGLDVKDDGRFRALSPETWLSDPRCHVFFLRAGHKLAGFAVVKEGSRLSGDAGVYDMAEFFVLKKYRRQRVGERAAVWLFDRFRGPWEVREKRENEGGTAFWRRAIRRYTRGRFEDFVVDDERWHGPVQRFDSR